MTATITLFDPTAPTQRAAATSGATAMGGLAGKTVGFIDNAKPNFNFLAEDLATLLKDRYGVKAIVTRRKKAASIPATAEIMREMTENCDLVIAGSGD